VEGPLEVSAPPETRYAKSGDLSIAYQVIGDGPHDLVHVPGLLNTMQSASEIPALQRLHAGLARFGRVIMFDKRGSGLSDRLPPDVAPTLEQRMDDIRAVVDAVGCEQVTLFGVADGGPPAILFAAAYPSRVASLILHDTAARIRWAPDYEFGWSEGAVRAFVETVERSWGTGLMARQFDFEPGLHREFTRMEQLAGTPGAIAPVYRAIVDTDVRALLPGLGLPVLVVHDPRSPIWPVDAARYLADRVPGARLELGRWMLLPGFDPEGVDDLVGLIEEFVTGAPPVVELDRVLKTVLFSDIADSTSRAAALGDRRWRELLDQHDAAVGREVERGRGNVVNTTGDGFLASFDGPARAIRCAEAVVSVAKELDLDVRVGLHTGECEVRGDDLAGIAVHIGARVAALAQPGEVLVTSTVRDLVAGSGIEFDDRGRHELKGVPGEWQLLAVLS
jgi:class 3 adenylate cyclase